MASGDRELDKVRLDKWLWAARFYKTRKLAMEAIRGGKVHINDQRVKPSRNVQRGDLLAITRAEDVFEITVLALNDKRRPANEAQLLYEESAESMARRESAREIHRLIKSGFHSGGKPDKHGRKALRRIRGR